MARAKTGNTKLKVVERQAAIPLNGQICREEGCDLLATTAEYCRAHYIKNWAAIKQKQAILQTGQLRRFIEDLVGRYPPEMIQALRHDLASEDAFQRACQELGFNDGFESLAMEGDSAAIEDAFVFETVRPEEEEEGGGGATGGGEAA